MKKNFNLVMTAFIMMATVSLVSCGKEENEENNNNPNTQSTVFAFLYNGSTLEAGATVELLPTMTETQNDFAQALFVVENMTDAEVQACIKVECVKGSGAHEIELCYDNNCRNVQVGKVTAPFTIYPGQPQTNEIIYDYSPSSINGTIVYKLTIGEGSKMKNPQVVFLKHAN